MAERNDPTQNQEELNDIEEFAPLTDDQEKVGIKKADDDEELIVTGTDTDISPEELSMLERMDGFEATADNQNLVKAALDNVDEEGEELNEDSFGEDLAGDDLDIESGDEEDLIDLDDQEEEE